MSESFDILVVGAGPAGIAAAVTAATAGFRVGLVDDNPTPGGQIWRGGGSQPREARKWLARLDSAPLVRLQGWRVFDSPRNGVLRAEGFREYRDLHFGKLILATGARERFLPFPGWTLPNVMGAGGLDAMVRGGLPIVGKRVVVAGTGPLLLAVAAHLAREGASIVALCEQAPLSRLIPFALRLFGEPAKLSQAIEYGLAMRAIKFDTGCWPVAAHGIDKLESVTLVRGGKTWKVSCDYLACGYHLVPNLELPVLLGCRIQDGFVATDALQRTSVANVFCAGEPTGIGGMDLAVVEGQVAGFAAAGSVEEAEKLARIRNKRVAFMRALESVTTLDQKLKGLATDATLVCRCEDVSYGELCNHVSWRDAKLQTRCGMGPCQGRICGTAAEFLFGWGSAIAQPNVRPPIFPAMVSSFVISDENPGGNDRLTPQDTLPHHQEIPT